MRTHATINERLLRRTCRERNTGRYGLTVIDGELPAFGLKVPKEGIRTFFVRVVGQPGARNIVLGTADVLTAAGAREKAIATIAAADTEHDTEPLFARIAQEFVFSRA